MAVEMEMATDNSSGCGWSLIESYCYHEDEHSHQQISYDQKIAPKKFLSTRRV